MSARLVIPYCSCGKEQKEKAVGSSSVGVQTVTPPSSSSRPSTFWSFESGMPAPGCCGVRLRCGCEIRRQVALESIS